jgi:hypothetical protein
MAHEADALKRRDPARAPVVEELHEGWEQSILGRVPRLEEVLVEADLSLIARMATSVSA